MEKIAYKFSPYTFARISAMKGELLDRPAYDRLMKMDLNEIIKSLQDSTYKEDINSLAVNYSGINLLEKALTRNLVRDLQKIYVISDSPMRVLVGQYLKRYDYYNLKTLARAKQANAREEEALDLFIPVGKLSKQDLKKLYSRSTIREILTYSRLADFGNVRKAVDEYEATGNLSVIENLLDYNYFADSVTFAEKIPSEGKLFKEFFKYEADIHNLKLVLRKIHFKLDKDMIKPFLVNGGQLLSPKTIAALVNADSFSSIQSILSKTEYANALKRIDPDMDPLLAHEVELDRFLLEKSLRLTHQKLLSVDVLLGYMFAKEIEIKNLRIIGKSKKFGVPEEKIRKMII